MGGQYSANAQSAYDQDTITYSLENSLAICEKAIEEVRGRNLFGTVTVEIPFNFLSVGYSERDNYMLELKSNLERALDEKYGWRCEFTNIYAIHASNLTIKPPLFSREGN